MPDDELIFAGLQDAACVTVDVVNALHFLHNMGVSHRDLKASCKPPSASVMVVRFILRLKLFFAIMRSRRICFTRRAIRRVLTITLSRCVGAEKHCNAFSGRIVLFQHIHPIYGYRASEWARDVRQVRDGG